ncbi:PREDICTED: LOB domain-containing protein 20-like [Camelina sativa]|uniref:LOB domain-containing protein 20-like n=1 Tax=Camelina sativa TaxID=90675 RepID=A0ABM0ZCH3_CAMSA|nr:PREDICTED: LOB domain-containing protein 20-like [Camelina sativa]
MADQQRPHNTSDSRRKSLAGRRTSSQQTPTTSSLSSGGGSIAAATTTGTGTASPCGACKFLRRKCVSGCIFAPHFGSDQGAARFAAVHKVFGASNVSKLLHHIPVNRRHDAVVTISYEAQARLSDPVYGCVSTILALQQQVASLQAELSVVQSQLINSRVAMANVMQQQTHHQQQQQQQLVVMQQPEYSNNSSASTTLAGAAMNSFTVAAEAADVSYDVMAPTNLEHSLPPMPPHQQSRGDQHHEDEEESGADFSVAVGSTAVASEVIFPAEGFHRR